MTTKNAKTTKRLSAENLPARIHLQEINIQGYRSCRTTTFSPDAELSALIGINGAGKTNVLNAIRLLSSRPSRAAFRSAQDETSTNEIIVTAWFLVDGKQIGLKRNLALAASNRNEDELVSLTEQWHLKSITRSRAWHTIPSVFYLGKQDARTIYEHEAYLLQRSLGRMPTRIRAADMDLLDNAKVINIIKKIYDFRFGIAYYSASQFTDPTRCPSSFEIDEDSRLSDTYGTSKVHLKFIYDLYRIRSSDPEQYTEYIRFVSRGQLGLISRITWKEIELSSNTADVKSGGKIKRIRKTKTLVIPKIQIGSSFITFNQLSEGTFKTLALIFYIMTDASRLLLIEEPEVCVHHGLLNQIIATIRAYSKNKQVIFSTHSDLVVDDLEPANVFIVEMLKGGTTVKPLESWIGDSGRIALHAYLEESGALGEYWRSGGLS